MNITELVAKEIGNKTREFYEFVMPPVDMHIKEDQLVILADMPGFAKEDVRVSLDGNILNIRACKELGGDTQHKIISSQRPNVIDKKIRLPIDAIKSNDAKEKKPSAKYDQGVLEVTIPAKRCGIEIMVQ